MAVAFLDRILTISRTQDQQSEIIDIEDWNVYESIDGIENPAPIDTAKSTRTLTGGDEGSFYYRLSWSIEIDHGTYSEGQTLRYRFEPSGISSDYAGILDWLTDEYDVLYSHNIIAGSCSIGITAGCL